MNIDMDAITRLIRDVAASAVMPHWRTLRPEAISQKTGPNDLVTIADKACELALTQTLTRLYPQSQCVGEEATALDPGRLRWFQTDAPLWVIDPIDGTFAFAHGKAEFAMMLALVEKGVLQAGWIYMPVQDDLYVAERGGGAWRVQGDTTTKLQPWAGESCAAALTGIIGSHFFADPQNADFLQQCGGFKKIINTVCAGHDYAALLRGEAQFSLHKKSMPWDHLPGLMLCGELGFVATKQDGSPYYPGDITGGLLVASGAAALAQVQARLFQHACVV